MSEDQFMGNLYQRFPVTVEKGKGAHVWDVDGREYIDCMGGYGVALVGHQNERVTKAIKEQVDKIITVHSSLYNKTREEFLKTLIGLAPKNLTQVHKNLTQVHLNNSGAEAVEAAMKFARKFTGKKGMVAMKGSYHGKSFGALSLTFNPKYKKAFQPLVEKVSFASYGDIESLKFLLHPTATLNLFAQLLMMTLHL
jgi:acetylornithine/LysW-gamma-L-lysine aminotransferase